MMNVEAIPVPAHHTCSFRDATQCLSMNIAVRDEIDWRKTPVRFRSSLPCTNRSSQL